ncbi:BPS1-LIKE PROTEIN [Salix viminalis]|uniref:BPS1-LIKE PROTEIN n=1 Tax=Salix viminalis TaxID=40686 RepID=A0A9Q0ZJ23_SALVM|nr:BPS1-LIKE PROTEIN [Salix viminalis]
MALPNFNALRDLHNSANDLLHSPEIQQVLVNQKQNLKKETLKSLKGMKGKSDISNVEHSIMAVVESLYGFCDETALHSANKRLEAVEIAVEDLEVELECTFDQTRVLLRNILTN